MGFASRLGAAWRGLSGKSADAPITSSLDLFRAVYGSNLSESGVVTSWSDVLKQSTGLACARVISEGVAQVPWRLYRDDGSTKKPAADHPLYDLLYRRPNRWQTSFEFRETICLHALLTFNAFVFVNRVGTKREIRELVPIEPQLVRVERDDSDNLHYFVRGKNAVEREFPSEAIWHIRGPSWNGWIGLDAIKLTREALGLSIAIERDQASLYRNGLRTSGVYSIDGNVTPEQYQQLSKYIEEHTEHKRGSPLILDRNGKFVSEALSGVDAQTLESRRMQVEEVCRCFRVMPIMVGHSDKAATYASAEQMFLAHVVHTLMPWYQRIEASGDVNLLSDQDRTEGYYTKFNANALMRGAAKDRAEYYAKALGAGGTKGWMTQNDVRELEEMDRHEDPEADALPQPTNQSQPLADPGASTGGA